MGGFAYIEGEGTYMYAGPELGFEDFKIGF
jgi:hypothetical protein